MSNLRYHTIPTQQSEFRHIRRKSTTWCLLCYRERVLWWFSIQQVPCSGRFCLGFWLYSSFFRRCGERCKSRWICLFRFSGLECSNSYTFLGVRVNPICFSTCLLVVWSCRVQFLNRRGVSLHQVSCQDWLWAYQRWFLAKPVHILQELVPAFFLASNLRCHFSQKHRDLYLSSTVSKSRLLNKIRPPYF